MSELVFALARLVMEQVTTYYMMIQNDLVFQMPPPVQHGMHVHAKFQLDILANSSFA